MIFHISTFSFSPVRTVLLLLFFPISGFAQLNWLNVDSSFGNLPSSVHVFRSTTPIGGKPNIAYYVEADLKDLTLDFVVDTTYKRRLTPQQFYAKRYDSMIQANATNFPLVVVNTSFFSFATNQNLNVAINRGQLIAYNVHTVYGRGKDTFTYRHPYGSAIGISKHRKADVAWLYTDSSRKFAYASQWPVPAFKDSAINHNYKYMMAKGAATAPRPSKLKKWKMQTAVGGGPVLLQDGNIRITNEEELKFNGKAIEDKHPRTAMGYTADGKLIILVVEGRHPNTAEGATLVQLAQIFKDLGCTEALNLDGGGSSCMLVNGKPTITVSDKEGQRPVPAVLMIFKR